MHVLNCPLRLPHRRLGLSNDFKTCCGRHASAARQSRLCAAEIINSSIDDLHVRRRSLAQSLELQGSAPDGHPDNTDLVNSPPAAAAALAAVVAASHRKHPTAQSSSSTTTTTSSRSIGMSVAGLNSSGSRGRIRRLRTGANGHSSSSNSTPIAHNGVEHVASPLGIPDFISAATTIPRTSDAPATPHQQRLAQHVDQQHELHQEQQQQQAASLIITSSSSSSSSSAAGEQSADIDELDKELQAEFHEVKCSQDVLDIVADEVARFSPYHTVTALNRLAKLCKGQPWQQRRGVLQDASFVLLLNQLQQQAALLNPFQLSTSLYSLGLLQVPLEQLVVAGSPRLLLALEAAISAQIGSFNDRDVSSTLYAYAQLKPKRQQTQSVITSLCQQAQSLTDRSAMSDHSLSMSLWSLATLGSSNAASHAFVQAAARRLRDPNVSFDVLGSQAVANSLWAAAKLGHHDQRLLEKGTTWLAQNLSKCKMQEVLNILWAAGAARHRPMVLGTIAKHVAAQAQVLKPADAASLFHVLGIFGFDLGSKPELLEALLPRVEQLLPQMKPFEVTSLYWGLGMTRQVDSQLFRQLTETIGQLQQRQLQAQRQLQQQQQQAPDQQQQQKLQKLASQLPRSLQRQAFQAFIAAKLEDVPDVMLHAEVLEELRSAWLAGSSGSSSSRRKQQQQQENLQPLLADLAWMLQQMKVKSRCNVRSKLDQLLVVDLELQASGQRLVALQILDEHSTDHQGNKLASVLWEEDVLRRNSYDDIFWLRVSELKRIPVEKRVRYFVDILRKLGVNPQERLVAAAEKAWVQGGRMSGGSAAAAGGGAAAAGAVTGSSWGMKGASGMSASELDVLMHDKGSSRSGMAGGWSSGGRGSRSRRHDKKQQW